MTELATIIAATDRLAQLENSDRLTRDAVEFVRDALGMERVSIFLSQPETTHVVMRGTWGTNANGCTTDERDQTHVCSREDFESLRVLHQHGALWEYRGVEVQDGCRIRSSWNDEGRPWLAITPLVAANEVVGVMYNDTAISRTPLDTNKQTNLAVFGSLLANVARERLAKSSAHLDRQSLAKTSRVIEKILAELRRDPQLTGEDLARRFRISPGHLARNFKLEVGTSLVEYRNRLRLERFHCIMQGGHRNLLEAALEAGFGSYAQFHRVHRSMVGVTPRQHFSSNRPNSR